MSAMTATHAPQTSRAPRRQLRSVELQTVDATRIIHGLTGRRRADVMAQAAHRV